MFAGLVFAGLLQKIKKSEFDAKTPCFNFICVHIF